MYVQRQECTQETKKVTTNHMIYIVQSYSAPNSIGDGDLFDHLTKHFGGDVTAVPAISDKVRGFTAKEYFKTGVATYKRLKDHDVMFGWGGDLCLYAWLRGIFGVKKVKYLSQNLIFNPEDTSLKQRIRGLLYRIAFKSKNFFATVNSPELKEFYAKTFHCNTDKFYTVLDAMDESDIESLSTSDTGTRGGISSSAGNRIETYRPSLK